MDENNSVGMQLNPNWILNEGKMPLEWRAFTTLKKNHSAAMKCFEFDVNKGGMVVCLDCKRHPHLANKKSNFFTGYFGMKKYGYKWEVFRDHIDSAEHKECVKETGLEKTNQPRIRLTLGCASSNPQNAIKTSGKFAQVSRLVNTVHTMVHKNIGIANFEDLIKMQLANGADMGDQYFSSESFKDIAKCFAAILKDDLKAKIKNHRFGCGMS